MDTPNNTRKAGDVISDVNHVRNYTQIGRPGGSIFSVLIPSGGVEELNETAIEAAGGREGLRLFSEGEVSLNIVAANRAQHEMAAMMGLALPPVVLNRAQVQDLHDTLGAILGAWPCTLPVIDGVIAYTADCPEGIKPSE